MKKIIFALGFACLTLNAISALAQNNQKCGCWYLGAGVGYSKFHLDDTVPVIPGATLALSDDDNDVGWKIFGGYQWNPNFAIELGWVDLGKASQTLTFTSPAIGSLTADFKSSGPFLDVLGIVPIGNNFSLLGKVGAYYANNSLDYSGSGPVATLLPLVAAAGTPLSEDKDEFKWKAGLGARYDFTPSVGVRAEWERYFDLDTDHSGGGTDVDLFSLNLIYSF